MSQQRIHNRASLKSRRQLRAQLTAAEALLWKYLQRSQLAGRKFRRQHSIGPYVVDFYCPGERLIIELDGAAHDHDTAFQRDERRTAYLGSISLRVLRFKNRSVIENPEAVLLQIRAQFMD